MLSFAGIHASHPLDRTRKPSPGPSPANPAEAILQRKQNPAASGTRLARPPCMNPCRTGKRKVKKIPHSFPMPLAVPSLQQASGTGMQEDRTDSRAQGQACLLQAEARPKSRSSREPYRAGIPARTRPGRRSFGEANQSHRDAPGSSLQGERMKMPARTEF